MTENELVSIKKRSVSGVIAYTVRTFLLQVVAFLATLILAAFLSPSDFGVFFLVSAVVNLFVFLSDVGLSASLIQKESEPTQKDLTTSYTVQQMLSILILILIVLLTPAWRFGMGLDESGVYLLYALGVSFLLASLKTIPSVLLERELNFKGLVLPQIVENLIFYTTAVYLAWRGYGVTSYTVAVIARGVAGILAIYIIKPWKPSLGIYKSSLRGLLKFGVPFQINDLLARIKDDLLFVVVKKFISTAEIGYLGWAKRWSLFPFRFSVDSIIRVTFPAYSRLQSDYTRLSKSIEKAMFFISVIIFPLLLGMAAMAYPLTIVISQYEKWQPALPALYLFIMDVGIASVVVPLTNALNAIGKIKTTLKLMTFWTTLIWVLGVPLTVKYGFVGIAMATALVAVSSLSVIYIAKKIMPISVLKNVMPQLLSAVGMFGVLVYLSDFSSSSITNFIISIIFGSLVYMILLLVSFNKRLVTEIKTLLDPGAGNY